MDKLNGAGVVYEGLQTLGEGAVLVGLILGTMVTFILEKKFLYAAIASVVGAALSFIGLIHAPAGGVGGQSASRAGLPVLRNRLRRILIPAGRQGSGRDRRGRHRRRALNVPGDSRGVSFAQRLVADERHLGAGRQHDVHPAPRVGALQLPLVPGARGVLGEQDVAGLQGELLAVAGAERQVAREGDDELADRRGVPGQRAAARGLLDRDVRRRHRCRHQVALRPGRMSRRPISTCEAPSAPSTAGHNESCAPR